MPISYLMNQGHNDEEFIITFNHIKEAGGTVEDLVPKIVFFHLCRGNGLVSDGAMENVEYCKTFMKKTSVLAISGVPSKYFTQYLDVDIINFQDKIHPDMDHCELTWRVFFQNCHNILCQKVGKNKLITHIERVSFHRLTQVVDLSYKLVEIVLNEI